MVFVDGSATLPLACQPAGLVTVSYAPTSLSVRVVRVCLVAHLRGSVLLHDACQSSQAAITAHPGSHVAGMQPGVCGFALVPQHHPRRAGALRDGRGANGGGVQVGMLFRYERKSEGAPCAKPSARQLAGAVDAAQHDGLCFVGGGK